MEAEFVNNAIDDFPTFVADIFPMSFKNPTSAPHLLHWAKRIQDNKKTATLSARKHLKSTLMYAYTMWRIFKMQDNEEWLYMSYTEPLSRYHTANIKKLIRYNPFFKDFQDLSNAESTLRYTDGKYTFSMNPASIMRFNRGWHGYGVICDDILADPTNELNLTIITTITNTFFEEVLSLPIEGGELHLVGTAQHQEDLFFTIKNKSVSFDWAMYQAILDDINKVTLWPEMFSYERLMEIKNSEIGEKAFSKEYMCSPVWSEDAYFKRDAIMAIVDSGLQNLPYVENNMATVYAGLDIGKVRHPSHFTIFLESGGLIIQIYQIFMDNWDYTKQVAHINMLISDFKIKRIYYDDTRSELESFAEQGIIRRGLWMPVKFTQSEKYKLASNFGDLVNKGTLRLQNNQRMLRSILSVNNSLEAMETVDGHGDAFWSIAMALSNRRKAIVAIAGGGKYK